jgi:hypothetical protein
MGTSRPRKQMTQLSPCPTTCLPEPGSPFHLLLFAEPWDVTVRPSILDFERRLTTVTESNVDHCAFYYRYHSVS